MDGQKCHLTNYLLSFLQYSSFFLFFLSLLSKFVYFILSFHSLILYCPQLLISVIIIHFTESAFKKKIQLYFTLIYTFFLVKKCFIFQFKSYNQKIKSWNLSTYMCTNFVFIYNFLTWVLHHILLYMSLYLIFSPPEPFISSCNPLFCLIRSARSLVCSDFFCSINLSFSSSSFNLSILACCS